MKRHCNELDGRTWTRYSISIWSDIKKTKEERELDHPALFPIALVERIIQCFMPPEGKNILDPFCGLGSTIIASLLLGRIGIGLDTNPQYLAAAQQRLEQAAAQKGLTLNQNECRFIQDDAANLLAHMTPESVDLIVTSPPYWNILTRHRSADRKSIRHYGDQACDLGQITDYQEFISKLGIVFEKSYTALRPGAYCIVVVMDLRKKEKFFPFHADLAAEHQRCGFIWDDLIIWDRRHEYNNFRPLGYPSVFRVNKAHEFVLIFQKPR